MANSNFIQTQSWKWGRLSKIAKCYNSQIEHIFNMFKMDTSTQLSISEVYRQVDVSIIGLDFKGRTLALKKGTGKN